jgi:hypothetical protein
VYSGQYVKSDLIEVWKPDISRGVANVGAWLVLAAGAGPGWLAVRAARKMLTGRSTPGGPEITDL